MPQEATEEQPLSKDQLELATWFAEYKRTVPPAKALKSGNNMWGWIKNSLSRIDHEDARTTQVDHGISLDRDDPISVVGALKYRCEVYKEKPPSKFKQAIAMLKRPVHPDTVQDELWLTDEELAEATREVELSGYEIDWGSG